MPKKRVVPLKLLQRVMDELKERQKQAGGKWEPDTEPHVLISSGSFVPPQIRGQVCVVRTVWPAYPERDKPDEVELSLVNPRGAGYDRFAAATDVIDGLRKDGIDGPLVWSRTEAATARWWPKLPEKKQDSWVIGGTDGLMGWRKEVVSIINDEAQRIATEHIIMRMRQAGVPEEMLKPSTVSYNWAGVLDKVSCSRQMELVMEGKHTWEDILRMYPTQ